MGLHRIGRGLMIDIRIQWLFWGIEYLVLHKLMINRHFGVFFISLQLCQHWFLVDVFLSVLFVFLE